MFKNIDFRTGRPLKDLILFAIPLALGQFLQILYNTVDSLVVGNFCGDAELAAVGVCATSSNVIIGFFTGLSIGAGVVVAKNFGMGDFQRLKDSIQAITTFGVLLGILTIGIGLVFAKPLLDVSGARPDYYDKAYTYLMICMGGVVFTCSYNISAGIIRAIGNSAATLKILAISGVVNVCLDLLFTGAFGWGVAGVAIATVIAQAVSMFCGIIFLHRYLKAPSISITTMWKKGAKSIKESLSVGVAAGIQVSVVAFSNTFIFRYVNMFDTTAVSGFGIGSKLDSYISIPLDSFGAAVTTGVGQNIGAGKYERIKPIIYDVLILETASCMIFGSLMLIFAKQLVGMFSSNPDVISAGTAMLRILIPLYWTNAGRCTFAGALRAYGKTVWPSVSALLSMVVVRQIFLAIVMTNPKIDYVFWCYPVGWIASSLFIMIYFALVRKELKGLGAPIAEV
ncbi:MAG: MATE family efflux transporter [Lachnospiraceae bacterium]|nr:MATE family efflux transporter [Candidatus Minthocola equi]